jgi:hypothetical protein
LFYEKLTLITCVKVQYKYAWFVAIISFEALRVCYDSDQSLSDIHLVPSNARLQKRAPFPLTKLFEPGPGFSSDLLMTLKDF